jgi:hypothetical protein
MGRWNWSNEHSPPGARTTGHAGVVTVKDSGWAAQRPFACLRGDNGDLWLHWWTGAQWEWTNNGTPPTSHVVTGPVGMTTVMDTPWDPERPYVFVRGDEGDLWINWWTGTQWEWADQGHPPDVTIRTGPIGVTTVMDSPQSAQRPYAFVLGSDGNLWVNWWSGSDWQWADQGHPPTTSLRTGAIAVTTVMDSPQSAQRPYAFALGNDGTLWINWWTGTHWEWADQGRPPGVTCRTGPIAVTTVMDFPQSPQRPYAFVVGGDGNLWINWWTGTVWAWADQGRPPTTTIRTGPAGVTTVMDTPQSAQRPYAFVLGNDGNLWINWWTGTRWEWADQDHPPTTALISAVGVTTVMDTPQSAQRPYAFVLGSDGNLWINWWE